MITVIKINLHIFLEVHFLSYESNIFDLGKLIGYFVEAFEESFKVQSSVDVRDLDVNEYGRLFGTLLKENKKLTAITNIFITFIKIF